MFSSSDKHPLFMEAHKTALWEHASYGFSFYAGLGPQSQHVTRTQTRNVNAQQKNELLWALQGPTGPCTWFSQRSHSSFDNPKNTHKQPTGMAPAALGHGDTDRLTFPDVSGS